MEKSINRKIEYAGVFLSVFIFYVLNIMKEFLISISADEIGTFASASKLAGLDWSSAISESRYYGYGWFWVFAGIFKLTDNPFVIYYTIYFANVVIMCLSGLLIYWFSINKLKCTYKMLSYAISVLVCCNYKYINNSYITNDTMTVFSLWILVICIYMSYDSQKQMSRVMFSICAGLVMSYTLTIHEKSVVVLLVSIPLVLVWRFLLKEWLVHPIGYYSATMVGYIIARMTKKWVVSLFWVNTESEPLDNTTVIKSSVFWFLDNKIKIKCVLDIIVTNLQTLNNKTFGLGYIIMLVCAFVVLKGIFSLKNTRTEFLKMANSDKFAYFLIIFSTLMTAIVIFGLADQWGNGCYEGGMMNGRWNKNIRAYSYPRYYLCYFGPAVVAISLLMQKQSISIKTYMSSILIMLMSYKYIVVFIKCYIPEEYASNIQISDDLIKNSIIIVVYIITCMVMHKKNQMKYFYPVLAILIMCFVFAPFISKVSKPNISIKNYHVYEFMRDNNISNSETIYTLDTTVEYQFVLSQYSVKVWNGEEAGIIVLKKDKDYYASSGKIAWEKYEKIELESGYVYMLKH